MGTRLANAPVFYTLAQIRHNPILKISDPTTIMNLQDSLRRMGYTDFQTFSAVDISFPESGLSSQGQQMQPVFNQYERYVFANKDASKSFVVDRNAVTFQTTAYETFETFSKDFIAGLEVINSCAQGFDFISRIGIRYLDAVAPHNHEDLPKFLQPGLLGITETLPNDWNIHYSLSECRAVNNPYGNVLTRLLITNGPLVMPADLQGGGFIIDSKFISINGIHAVIDTDASMEERISFDISEAAKILDNLHKSASTAFRATVTETAIAAWS
jgi:uncharacterized protein (TIGR04255 family)